MALDENLHIILNQWHWHKLSNWSKWCQCHLEWFWVMSHQWLKSNQNNLKLLTMLKMFNRPQKMIMKLAPFKIVKWLAYKSSHFTHTNNSQNRSILFVVLFGPSPTNGPTKNSSYKQLFLAVIKFRHEPLDLIFNRHTNLNFWILRRLHYNVENKPMS